MREALLQAIVPHPLEAMTVPANGARNKDLRVSLRFMCLALQVSLLHLVNNVIRSTPRQR